MCVLNDVVTGWPEPWVGARARCARAGRSPTALPGSTSRHGAGRGRVVAQDAQAVAGRQPVGACALDRRRPEGETIHGAYRGSVKQKEEKFQKTTWRVWTRECTSTRIILLLSLKCYKYVYNIFTPLISNYYLGYVNINLEGDQKEDKTRC